MRWFLAGVVVVGLALGCAGLGRRRGLDHLEISSSGALRHAWIHVPSSWGEGPHPLVIAMHGGGKAGQDHALRLAAAWRPHFDDDMVLAFPEGAYRGGLVEGTDLRHPRTWTQWDDEESLRGTDLVFIRDLIDAIAETTDVDRAQVYLTGFSSGASFVWYASCFDPEPYAGFGVVGMPMPPDIAATCAPSIKRPLVSIHGAQDSWFPIMGTSDPWADTATWLTENRRCGTWPVEQPWVDGEHGVRAHGALHACQTVRSVELWRIEGIGHCWPGGPGCRGVNATALLFDYWSGASGLP